MFNSDMLLPCMLSILYNFATHKTDTYTDMHAELSTGTTGHHSTLVSHVRVGVTKNEVLPYARKKAKMQECSQLVLPIISLFLRCHSCLTLIQWLRHFYMVLALSCCATISVIPAHQAAQGVHKSTRLLETRNSQKSFWRDWEFWWLSQLEEMGDVHSQIFGIWIQNWRSRRHPQQHAATRLVLSLWH